MSFFTDFVSSARNTQRMFAEREAAQYAEDANRRANEEAQRKTDADARQQQMAADLATMSGDTGYQVADDGTQGGSGERETERLNVMMTQRDKMLKSAEIARKGSNFVLENKYLDQARKFQTSALDQTIKTQTAQLGEAEVKAGLAGSISDQASLDNALAELFRNGYSKDAMRIYKATNGGVYTPGLQPVLDAYRKAALSGNESLRLDLAISKDARDSRNQQSIQNDRELDNVRQAESLALRRDKHEQAKQPKAVTETEARQQYILEKEEFEGTDETPGQREELDRLRELRDEYNTEGGRAPTPAEMRSLVRLEAVEGKLRDFPTFLARKRKKEQGAAAPFEAHPVLEPGATVGSKKARLKAYMEAQGIPLTR